MTRLVTYILALFIFLSAVLAVWMNHVDEFDPVRAAVELKAAGQRDQALDLIHFAKEHKLGPADELDGLAAAYQYTTTEKVKDVFWTGAVQGRVTNLYSGIGSVATDLVVIGDVRDLAKEGWHLISGQRVDKIVAALSAIGVGVTALEATGVGVVLDAGVAAAKASVKYSARLVRAAPTSVLKTLSTGRQVGGRVYGAVWDMFRQTNLSAPSVAVILSRTSDIRLLDSAAALTRGLKRGAAVFIDRAGTGGLKTFQRFRDLGLGDYFIRAVKTNPRGVLGVTRFNSLVRSAKIVKKQGWLAPLAVGVASLASLMALMPPILPWLVLILTGLYLWWRWNRRRWFRLRPAPAQNKWRQRRRAQAPAQTPPSEQPPDGEAPLAAQDPVAPGPVPLNPAPFSPAPFRPANDPARWQRPVVFINPQPEAAKPAPPPEPPPEKPSPAPKPLPPRTEPPKAAKASKPKATKPVEPAKPKTAKPVEPAKPKTAKPVEPAKPRTAKPAKQPPKEQPHQDRPKIKKPEPVPKATPKPPQAPPPPQPREKVKTEPKAEPLTSENSRSKREAQVRQPHQAVSQMTEHHLPKESKKPGQMISQAWTAIRKIDWLREKGDSRPASKNEALDSEGAKDAAGSLPKEYGQSATQIALGKAEVRKQRAEIEKATSKDKAGGDQSSKTDSEAGEPKKDKGIREKIRKPIEAWRNVPWIGKSK